MSKTTISEKVDTRTPSSSESDLDFVIRVACDLEQRMKDVLGESAETTLFGLTNQLGDWLSEDAVRKAHQLRRIRNDLAHGEAKSIAECPSQNGRSLRTRDQIKRVYGYIKSEIRQATKRRQRCEEKFAVEMEATRSTDSFQVRPSFSVVEVVAAFVPKQCVVVF